MNGQIEPNAGHEPLLTDDEVIARLRLDAGRTKQAASMALLRAWRRAQDIRHDRGQDPLRRRLPAQTEADPLIALRLPVGRIIEETWKRRVDRGNAI